MTKPVNNNLPEWQVAPGFEARVKEAFDGATLTEIAEKTGENYHTLRNYLKLKRDPPPRFLIAIAELTSYSPYWLLASKGPKLIEGEYAGPLFRLEPPEELSLSAEEKQLIRTEVVEVLRDLLLSGKDRDMSDSLLASLQKQIAKETKKK